jgi:hypothetical protein
MAILSSCGDYNGESTGILPQSTSDKKVLNLRRHSREFAFQEDFNAMQLRSPSTFLQRSSPKHAIPYTSAAMRQDLERLRNAWDDCQASLDRNAIYGYLTAVYGLVAWL